MKRRRNTFKGLWGGLGGKPAFSEQMRPRWSARYDARWEECGSLGATAAPHAKPFIRKGEVNTVASPVACPVSSSGLGRYDGTRGPGKVRPLVLVAFREALKETGNARAICGRAVPKEGTTTSVP